MSLDGGIGICFVVDPVAVPDSVRIASHLVDELEALTSSIGVGHRHILMSPEVGLTGAFENCVMGWVLGKGESLILYHKQPRKIDAHYIHELGGPNSIA